MDIKGAEAKRMIIEQIVPTSRQKATGAEDRASKRGLASRPLPPRKRSRREKSRRLVAPALDVTGSLPLEPHGTGKKDRLPTPAEWMRAARLAQGLPPVVTDPVVLNNVRTIMRAGLENKVAEVVQLKPRPRRLFPQVDTHPQLDQPSRDVAL